MTGSPSSRSSLRARSSPARSGGWPRRLKESEKNDTYDGKRRRRAIDYLLLSQLLKIINNHWKDFERLFPPGKHWVQPMIENDFDLGPMP